MHPDASRYRAIWSLLVLVLGLSTPLAARSATPPTVEDFASPPLVEDVAISPDGRYLALIGTHGGRASAVVIDRRAAQPVPRPILTEPEHFKLKWCHWATETRLLCGFRGMYRDDMVYPVTRLAAVDADGKNIRVLVQNNAAAQGPYQDRIVHWHPGPKETVLLEADEGIGRQVEAGAQIVGDFGTHALPAVFQLNVVSGRMEIIQHAREPIRNWVCDHRGKVRLGYGLSGPTLSYWARLDGDSDWRRLAKFEVFTRNEPFEPIAISDKDPNKAYAFGPSDGRRALWLIDLQDREDPKLIFAHPRVDVADPVLDVDDRLLAVRYETAQPMQYFEDDELRILMNGVAKLIPDSFTTIHGSTLDQKTYILRSVSDIDAPGFSVLDTTTNSLSPVVSAYPGRDKTLLAPMRPISYPARDGTEIPGYLSVPRGLAEERLPLIVMPHGGPIARDTWGYFFLRQFLVSRGYAVLQMNFRGSSGYGADWFFAAHQDWGGLTYEDVIDGARWAIRQGIADPARVCIVGWSFGGYVSLLGAQRNSDLFRCAVDIAGVSDLALLIDEQHNWLSGAPIAQRQIGTDREKLKLNSPRQHAADFKVPLLMLHGKMDAQVPFEQSEVMDAALRRAGKPHQLSVFPDADHQFSDAGDRARMLHEIESFLGEQLGPTH